MARLLPDTAWLALTGVAVVLLAAGLLSWAARHMGASTREGEAFMASLGRSPSRFVRPGGGR